MSWGSLPAPLAWNILAVPLVAFYWLLRVGLRLAPHLAHLMDETQTDILLCTAAAIASLLLQYWLTD